ncbi:hypothetical protein M434DRAFT_216946 [Hypoxylon sp. CO27-5]|nr:hypothetical protein M434DRAFT_216946 [Hypoxylon sp. CO27-5]
MGMFCLFFKSLDRLSRVIFLRCVQRYYLVQLLILFDYRVGLIHPSVIMSDSKAHSSRSTLKAKYHPYRRVVPSKYKPKANVVRRYAPEPLPGIRIVWSLERTNRLFFHTLNRITTVSTKFDYKSFIEGNGHANLIEKLRASCEDAFHIIDHGFIRDQGMIHGLPGHEDGCHSGAAWYLLMLTDNLVRSWFRLYAGQADVFPRRKTTHASSARGKKDRMQLVHVIWSNSSSRTAKFGILGKCTWEEDWSKDERQMWKNIGEMFFVVAFQTIPHLFELAADKGGGWYPDDVDKQEAVGLNVQMPIYQGDRENPRRFLGVHMLHKSADPEVVAHATRNDVRLAVEISQKGNAAQAATGYRNAILNHPVKYEGLVWRRADELQGDLQEVPCYCTGCGEHHWIDKFPKWSLFDGKYLVSWNIRCPTCCRNTMYLPIDRDVKWLRLQTAVSRYRNWVV